MWALGKPQRAGPGVTQRTSGALQEFLESPEKAEALALPINLVESEHLCQKELVKEERGKRRFTPKENMMVPEVLYLCVLTPHVHGFIIT